VATEWVRFSVLRYVREVAAYEKRIRDGIERAKRIRLDMEGVGAVRYDRDGSRSTWADHRPESLDILDDIADHLDADIQRWAREAEEAHRLFMRYDETAMVWEKWGEKMTWAKVARLHGYSERQTKRKAELGLEIVYELMPEEWRRAPYPAQPWKDGPIWPDSSRYNV
jgi:hypothetical protein